MDANTQRWDGYLSKVFEKGNSYLDTAEYKRLAVKCVQTLLSNWRSPAGALRHNGIFPSTAYQGFYGFWSWDSWKHAVALAGFDESLAKESIRSMFDFQNASGMIADCVYHDSIENNWRDTKPPLAAWAVWKVFEATGDTGFIKEMYPKLLKYHNWWYKYRDNNNNGLCEYGSTDGTVIAAKWESGMDNAVRFDNSSIRKNKNGEWSLDQESVDLNVYLQQEKVFLSKLAAVAGAGDHQQRFAKEAEDIAGRIRTYFWSAEGNYFMDYNYMANKFVPSYGPEGWIALWAGIANKEQSREIAGVMTDKNHFNTKVPLPTIDISNPAFDPENGYWRGPVWLDQLYFGVEGLRKYGYEKEAAEMTFKMLRNSEGLLDQGAIRENYHPVTGKGLNAGHFSWSAAMIILLLAQ
jgi:putative isomerase